MCPLGTIYLLSRHKHPYFLHAASPGDPSKLFVPRHSPGPSVGGLFISRTWDGIIHVNPISRGATGKRGDVDLRETGHGWLVISVIRSLYSNHGARNSQKQSTTIPPPEMTRIANINHPKSNGHDRCKASGSVRDVQPDQPGHLVQTISRHPHLRTTFY